MKEKFEKLFLVFKILGNELVTGLSLGYEQNTCYRASTFQQTFLKVNGNLG